MRLCPPLLLAALACALASAQSTSYYSVPPVDSPVLAARGQWPVGVRTLDLVHAAQPDILRFDAASGKAPLADRTLKVEVWYPAVIPAGQREHTVYESSMPHSPQPGVPESFQIAGKALRDAPPIAGQAFPLVVVSHGYPGSRTFLTYLTENLASKGYVVAAIDHTDSVWGRELAFSSTLLNRANDQTFTIEELSTRALGPADFLHGLLDPARVAVIGYSMGGYGALATAGAGYSKQGAGVRTVPGGYLEPWTAESPAYRARHRENLKAMVAIAPWGAQPPQNNWDAQGLSGIRVPSLFIAGDQDDVSGFEAGTKKIYENAVNSDRYLLVYQNARHNVGGNPTPPEAMGTFAIRGFFEEPVWRKERIGAINQHMITAFLDLYVKGDESRRAYLDGASADGAWKGFQRRWSLGLELHHRAAGQAAPPATPDWGPLQPLLGAWTGEGGGQPGQGAGAFSFAPDLQGTILVRKNFAEYPAANGKPSSRHDDLMIVYRDEATHALRATYYDNEGHTIAYGVTAAGAGVVFLSEGPPAMPRFRMTYTPAPPDKLAIKFEIAPPGKEFATYIEASARRDATRAVVR